MKIYKLDINTTQPTNQVVAMQQNSTGMLSVDVTNNGWPIRNLSCALYDEGNEISATLSGESGAGYKVDVGDTYKAVKFTAKSEPIESINQYVASYTAGTKRTVNQALFKLVLPQGVYKQDEFMPLLEKVDANSNVATTWLVNGNSLSNTNFGLIKFTPWIPTQKMSFYTQVTGGTRLPEDELITASAEVSVYTNQTLRVNSTSSIVISSDTYPAVGYYVDYSKDTVIRPSTNAGCWGERDIVEPTPEPDSEPDSEPETTPETPVEEPNE